MADESLRVTKLASTTRLSDRYLTVQIKEAPEPGVTATAGVVGALVEIEGSWQANAQLGQTIINTAARHYFRGTHAHPVANFEDALKKVNETLKQATQTGATDWIGHLHAALILVVGTDIHIAATGHVYAMLLRDGVGTPMHEATPEGTQAPGKAFGALLSGTIERGDQLILGSSGFEKLITSRELETLFESPEALAQRLGTLLHSKRGAWVNALLIDAPTQPSAEHATTIAVDRTGMAQWQTATAQLIARTQRLIKPLGAWFVTKPHQPEAAPASTAASLAPTVPQAKQLADWSAARLDHLHTTTLPAVRKQASNLWSTLLSSVSSLKASRANKAGADAAAPAAQTPDATSPATHSLIGRPVYAIRDYASVAAQAQEQVVLPTNVTNYQDDTITQQRPTSLAARLRVPDLRALAKRIEWRSILFGLIALILLIILAANITVITTKRQTEESKQELLTQLNELQDTLEEARLARIFNQPDKAADALATVLAGLPALLDSPVSDGARLLADKAQGELDEATSTTRLANATKIADVQGATYLVQSGTLISVINATGGINRIDASSGQNDTIAVPGGHTVLGMTAYDNQAGIVVLTDEPSAHSLSPGQDGLTPLTSAGDWKAGPRIASFFGNLYVLAADDNQVWKYLLTQGTYGKPEGFLTNDTSLSGAIDLAVDGQLYILFKDGSVKRLNRGKADSFALGAPPKPTATLTNPKQLLTTRDSSRLYILDGDRIVSFDKSGAFQAQYAFKDLRNIRAISLDEGKKVFTLLTDEGVYTSQF